MKAKEDVNAENQTHAKTNANVGSVAVLHVVKAKEKDVKNEQNQKKNDMNSRRRKTSGLEMI